VGEVEELDRRLERPSSVWIGKPIQPESGR